MINFRYHLVSVGSVVVAVVAGLALGAAAVTGSVAAPVVADADAIGERDRDLQEQIDRLAERLSAGDRFAEELAPVVLGGRLATRSVIVITTPSADGVVSGVEAMLHVAGATVTGRLELTDRFSDPSRRDDLLNLAFGSLPPGVTAGLPITTDGILATAAVLGAVVVRQPIAVSDGDMRGVLATYVSQGFLTGTSVVTSPADAVVVVTGGTPPGGKQAGSDAETGIAVASLVTGLSGVGTVVLAGIGATADTAVGRLRADPRAATKVSTVDNLGTPPGKLVTALALSDQLAGRVGHYGTGPGAAGPLPATVTPAAAVHPAPARAE